MTIVATLSRLKTAQVIAVCDTYPASLKRGTSAAPNSKGLDDYRRARGYAVRPGGLIPTDVVGYYNIQALRDAGLDGSGQTIMLPEIDDLPNLNDLDKFATKFGLPPFGPVLTVKRDPN